MAIDKLMMISGAGTVRDDANARTRKFANLQIREFIATAVLTRRRPRRARRLTTRGRARDSCPTACR